MTAVPSTMRPATGEPVDITVSLENSAIPSHGGDQGVLDDHTGGNLVVEVAVRSALHSVASAGERLRSSGDLDRRVRDLAARQLGEPVLLARVTPVRQKFQDAGALTITPDGCWVNPCGIADEPTP